MTYGYNGKIARVNLSQREIKVEKPKELFYRKYMGGRGIVAFYLLKELKPGIDPLKEDNKLIFTTSILTGAPFPGNSRFTVGAKSPLTGAYGESQAGGFWAAELKFSGYDAIVIEGRSSKPVYLWIHDGKIEIKDATHCWGCDTGETEKIIKEELDDQNVKIACIGPAGENLVRFACIVNDLTHVNGRTGMGAVMGSKNLKAVAVRGNQKVKIKNPPALHTLTKLFNENYKKNLDNFMVQKIGTAGYVVPLNEMGLLPTYNFRRGTHEEAQNISGEKMLNSILIGRKGCYACPQKCKRIVKVDNPEVDPRYGGPEYETLASLGSNCGIFDIKIIAKGNELCNKLGLDTISTGNVIALAMECFENNILREDMTDGIDLKFGSSEALLRLIEMIASRKGLGDLLAEGSMRAARKLGKEAEKFTLQVKGQEVPLHDPRGKVGAGLMYAMSPIGADHLQAEHDGGFATETFALEQIKALGILQPVDTLDLGPAKVRLLTYIHLLASLYDVLDVCMFVGLPVRVYTAVNLVELVSSITGWQTSMWELMKAGERGINMARCFNIREGFKRKDDSLPQRFFEGLEGGPLDGKKMPLEAFESAITRFYAMMGWDPNTGIPTRSKLEELDIEWVANEIEKTLG